MPAPAQHEFSALQETPSEELEPLALELFEDSSQWFADELTITPVPLVYGITDGNAVGTFAEESLKVLGG